MSHPKLSRNVLIGPSQGLQLSEVLNCHVCKRRFSDERLPFNQESGQVVCEACIDKLPDSSTASNHRICQSKGLLPNYAFMLLVGAKKLVDASSYSQSPEELEVLNRIRASTEALAVFLVPCLPMALSPIPDHDGVALSRPLQRKLTSLLTCQPLEDEGRIKLIRAARSVAERCVTEVLVQHQNSLQQVSASLWSAVRSRGCQFLGPYMQEQALRLILLVLEGGESLSRKVIVMMVVMNLQKKFPHASKTAVGHVVQLLYRASCFNVQKQENESSMMQLRPELRTYESLRREHDSQLVQIAIEAGLRISPEQWSTLLYGDLQYKSHMQSIIDKLQPKDNFRQSVEELRKVVLQQTNSEHNLTVIIPDLDYLVGLQHQHPEDDSQVTTEVAKPSTLTDVACCLEAVTRIFQGVHIALQHSCVDMPHQPKYKTSFCKERQETGRCTRGNQCTFAHSKEELNVYRQKSRSAKQQVQSGGTGAGRRALPNSLTSREREQMMAAQSKVNSRVLHEGRDSSADAASYYPAPHPQYYQVTADRSFERSVPPGFTPSPHHPNYPVPHQHPGRAYQTFEESPELFQMPRPVEHFQPPYHNVRYQVRDHGFPYREHNMYMPCPGGYPPHHSVEDRQNAAIRELGELNRRQQYLLNQIAGNGHLQPSQIPYVQPPWEDHKSTNLQDHQFSDLEVETPTSLYQQRDLHPKPSPNSATQYSSSGSATGTCEIPPISRPPSNLLSFIDSGVDQHVHSSESPTKPVISTGSKRPIVSTSHLFRESASPSKNESCSSPSLTADCESSHEDVSLSQVIERIAASVVDDDHYPPTSGNDVHVSSFSSLLLERWSKEMSSSRATEAITVSLPEFSLPDNADQVWSTIRKSQLSEGEAIGSSTLPIGVISKTQTKHNYTQTGPRKSYVELGTRTHVTAAMNEKRPFASSHPAETTELRETPAVAGSREIQSEFPTSLPMPVIRSQESLSQRNSQVKGLSSCGSAAEQEQIRYEQKHFSFASKEEDSISPKSDTQLSSSPRPIVSRWDYSVSGSTTNNCDASNSVAQRQSLVSAVSSFAASTALLNTTSSVGPLNTSSLAQPPSYSSSLAQPSSYASSLAQPTSYSSSLSQPPSYSSSLAQPPSYSSSLAQPPSLSSPASSYTAQPPATESYAVSGVYGSDIFYQALQASRAEFSN